MNDNPGDAGNDADAARRREFLLIEHRWLQEKERHDSEDLYRTETIVPIAIGLIYAWLLAGENGPRNVPWGLWWVPVIITAFGAVRQRLRYKALWGYHHYMRSIEREVYGGPPEPYEHRAADAPMPKPSGWQAYWRSRVTAVPLLEGWDRSPHAVMRIAFWLIMGIGTLVLAVDQTVCRYREIC